MSKQTAVDWLLDQLEQKGDMRETPSIRNLQLNIDISDYLDLKRQAKAMEKEQIIDALKYSYKRDYFTPNFREQQELFEQYYNETYGGDK